MPGTSHDAVAFRIDDQVPGTFVESVLIVDNCRPAVGQNPDTFVLRATTTTPTTTSTTTTACEWWCPHFSPGWVPARNARRVRLPRRGEKWRGFVPAAPAVGSPARAGRIPTAASPRFVPAAQPFLKFRVDNFSHQVVNSPVRRAQPPCSTPLYAARPYSPSAHD